MTGLPVLRMLARQDRRLRAGRPWAFANELDLDAARELAPGTIVNLEAANGERLGTASFNRHSLIAARLYSRQANTKLDQSFFAGALRRALALRERFFSAPFYRLAHAEGDGLPGFIIDRFDRVLTVQANTAGAEGLLPVLLAALDDVLAPGAVVLRQDSPVRALEGLESYVRTAAGPPPDKVEVLEGGCRFPVDLMGGQKTGWYFDLAAARAQVAALAAGVEMLDLFSHSGAFAVTAAKAGARHVLAVESSAPALELAAAAAAASGVSAAMEFRRGDVFEELQALAAKGRGFGLVVADPPSFVKSKKELAPGARGYRKLARLAAHVVAPEGLLFIACCSHHVSAELFAEEVAAGLEAAGRGGRIVAQGGAGPDHPVHPHLPETAYLKHLLIQVD
jgi:23S rRNA (cytosine1962-C5)-methyltransferase